MGKSKGGGGKKGKGSGGAAAAPKCTCDHPFNCSCGNRPARPSRGHKWDPETQQWGGKGHKQKGASGQIASKSAEATTTSVGKTTIAQWQKLPTVLLDDACKKEGRPRPKYKQIGNYKFRVIVQDAKAARRGTDHDLIMVPASGCENEEQAKQEAALLALLHLTPKIPHERKLPEPYKTTWLNAVEAAKKPKANAKAPPAGGKPTGPGSSNAGSRATSEARQSGGRGGRDNRGGDGAAKASSNLSLATLFVSRAEKKKQDDERRKARLARFQKIEAIRMANKDHQVFLSAKSRKRIETILRGEDVQWEEEDEGESRNDDETPADGGADADGDADVKAYVVSRLNGEGFTRAQARTAFGQLDGTKQSSGDESLWDGIYDECLQWLCINLDEDQLPEGFDPRGRTLDILAPLGEESTDSVGVDSREAAVDSAVVSAVAKYGLSKQEAVAIGSADSEDATQIRLWSKFLEKAGNVDLIEIAKAAMDDPDGSDRDTNLEMAAEELEAMEAIFDPSEFSVSKQNDGTTLTSIMLPSESSKQKLRLEIITSDGDYPTRYPLRVMIRGEWSRSVGTAVHVGLIKLLTTLPVSEPMMYEIFGTAQTLLQEAADGDLEAISLSGVASALPKSRRNAPNPAKQSSKVSKGTRQQQTSTDGTTTSGTNTQKRSSSGRVGVKRRPRERAPFWSKHPSKTPPAQAFPVVEGNLKKARAGLPAAKARDEFLAVMKKSEKVSCHQLMPWCQDDDADDEQQQQQPHFC